MSRTHERVIGLGLGALAIGLLSWHTPNWIVDPADLAGGRLPLSVGAPVIALCLIAIYLLLRPDVSK